MSGFTIKPTRVFDVVTNVFTDMQTSKDFSDLVQNVTGQTMSPNRASTVYGTAVEKLKKGILGLFYERFVFTPVEREVAISRSELLTILNNSSCGLVIRDLRSGEVLAAGTDCIAFTRARKEFTWHQVRYAAWSDYGYLPSEGLYVHFAADPKPLPEHNRAKNAISGKWSKTIPTRMDESTFRLRFNKGSIVDPKTLE